MAATSMKVGRKSQRSLGPADGDKLIFQGLAQYLQHPAAELRKFIQEQYSPMGQGDLARLGPGAAAHQTSVGDGMVGRPERAVLEQWGVVEGSWSRME